MTMMIKLMWGTLFLGIAGGAFALSMWGIPAPSAKIQKVIPAENFYKK